MKVDRRSFLSFVVGGAAGTALSPLPWKLIDDFSIWSQVWPWVPVPKGGESVFTWTTCSLCPGGCGIVVRKVDNRVVKIEGLANHPVNDGGICSLGLSGLQLLYGPSRVKTPLRRIGDRGSGRWQKITWDEAISIVSDKLAKIRVDGETHKVACVSGLHAGTVSSLFQRFFDAYGSANFVRMSSGTDVSVSVLKYLCGVDISVNCEIDYDFENSDFILSLGSGLVDGWTSPVRMIMANSEWRKKNIEVVQIEPVFSSTAANATQWIPINPGTESDLAFGIAAYIVKYGLHDSSFVAQRFGDFDELKRSLISNYSLEFVSKVTGIPSDVIVRLSKSFANSSSPIALCGRGNGTMPGSFRDYASVHLLNILKGNINKRGGISLYKGHDHIVWPPALLDSIAETGLKLGCAGELDNSKCDFPVNRLIDNISSNENFLKALFVSGANPCYTLSGTASVREAFRKVPFLVSFSSFMDETSVEADLILPDHLYLEKLEDIPVFTGSGRSTISLSVPVVSPQFNTMHLGETIIGMAHALGGTVAESFPWENYEECLESTLSSKWYSIRDTGCWVGDKLETVELSKFDFIGTELPTTKVEGNAQLFPLYLLPYDSIHLPSNYIAAPPFLLKTVADTVIKGKVGFVDINPQTAKALDIDDGDCAILATPKGQAKVRVHFCDGTKPGVITMVRGLGHTAYDGYIANKGVNVNDLIGPVEDPEFGHDAVWGIRARLTKS